MKFDRIVNLILSTIILIALANHKTFAQVEDVQLYTFAHSLIDHRPPAISTPSDETTIAHWIYDIAENSSKSFATTGQFGQLANHVDGLPPNSNLGYDNPPYSWDEEQTTFAASSLNTIMLTAANFIQYSDPSEADPADPAGRTVIELTESIFDWTDAAKPNMRYYIYANWPEMDLMNAYPPTLPLASEVDEFHDITIGNVGPFAEWWITYQNLMVESRPDLDIKLIPVGMLISKILKEIIPNEIPFEELYEDSAPHGRANIYFLAGMISYMAMYEENVPDTYNPSELIHSAVRNNLEIISDFIWNELNEFNFPTGDSRVFYSTNVNNENDLNTTSNKISILPIPSYDFITISSSAVDVMDYQILNLDGQVLMEDKSIYSNHNVDISRLPDGIYFVKIFDKSNKKNTIKRIIKQ